MPSPFVFTSPNTAIDLTTVALVHGVIRVPTISTSDDELIQMCITAAGFEFLWRTGRCDEGQEPTQSPFVSPVVYDEVYDGNGSDRLFLRNWPIVSVNSLTVNGQSTSQSTGYGSVGWTIVRGKSIVIRSPSRQFALGRAACGRGFSAGVQNVEVNYTAGYSQVPADIVRAVTHWVAVNYKRTNWLDEASKTMGAQGVTGTNSYRSWEMPPEIRSVIAFYKRDIPA